MDDESYFSFDGSDTANNKHFYYKGAENVDPEVHFKRHKKLNKHSDRDFMFWPDMATAHYAANVIAAYEDLNINYIPKEKNVPNVYQLRPIECFWRNLKREIYSGGWEASSHKELKQHILLKIWQSKTSKFENLMHRTLIKYGGIEPDNVERKGTIILQGNANRKIDDNLLLTEAAATINAKHVAHPELS
ncbi:hypothetical protein ILUMI_23409 [Ignelater luminosus]|uniref:Uncharacterized protein n=1 Tax=Ignelater luminosus TaxID=2038154 RepID=A0A8K0CFB9_IGNLU|nr:hypothetical protein ILUMI_23409 [Ignelater luminosus]